MLSRVFAISLFSVGMSLFVLSMDTASAAPFADTVLLSAEQTPISKPFGEYGQLTALGILGAMALFIVCKMLPDLHGKFTEQSKIFAETIAQVNQIFAESLASSNQALHENTKTLAELKTHCAEHWVRYRESE